MTREQAAAIIAKLITGYPTQRRDADFQGLLALELVASNVPFDVAARRVSHWIRTEPFWPAISDLVEPHRPTQDVRLLPPPDPYPTTSGLDILRSAMEPNL